MTGRLIEITPNLAIQDKSLQWTFITAPGPGGQHVNKSATAVQLRFNVADNEDLPEPVRQRLMQLAGSRLTRSGDLIITAHRFRSQHQNREDALDRLINLLRLAAKPPRKRHKTAPPKSSRKRRLNNKKNRGRVKKLRRRVSGADDE